MRIATIVMLLVSLLGVGHAGPPPGPPYTGPVSDRARVCNMQDTVQSDPGIERQYLGQTYHFCCEGCASSFDGDPKKYAFATDPVSGAQVDKATALMFAVKNHLYYFATAKSRDTFAKAPERYLKGG